MAQFHYVLGFDTELNKWFVEFDTTAYFLDGHVFDQNIAEKTGYGWVEPQIHDMPEEAMLDKNLMNTLNSLVDIIPIPTKGEL